MAIHIYKNADEVNRALAEFFISKCNEAISKKGYGNIVLSGGNSPKKLHQLLAAEYADKTEWQKLRFYFGDERNVPFDSPDNNGAMAKNTLFDPLGIGPSNIYYIDTSLPPEAAAEAYARIIPDDIDFIFLGLGDNVHTASLFPFTDVLHEESATVKSVYVDEIKATRITLTAPLINHAATIAFLVYGQAKAEALQHAVSKDLDYEKYPAQLIQSDNTHWFVDEAAAKNIT